MVDTSIVDNNDNDYYMRSNDLLQHVLNSLYGVVGGGGATTVFSTVIPNSNIIIV